MAKHTGIIDIDWSSGRSPYDPSPIFPTPIAGDDIRFHNRSLSQIQAQVGNLTMVKYHQQQVEKIFPRIFSLARVKEQQRNVAEVPFFYSENPSIHIIFRMAAMGTGLLIHTTISSYRKVKGYFAKVLNGLMDTQFALALCTPTSTVNLNVRTSKYSALWFKDFLSGKLMKFQKKSLLENMKKIKSFRLGSSNFSVGIVVEDIEYSRD